MIVLSNEQLTRRIEALEHRLDYIIKILDDNQLHEFDDDEEGPGEIGGDPEFYKY